jgi:Ca2+-binding EF-hand superfamily protein
MVGMADCSAPLLQYNEDGTMKETLSLISYAEYRFLCTLLTAPDNYLRVAFRLMDRDGSDSLSIDEVRQSARSGNES